MATNNEREFLGRDGTEQLVAKVIALLSDKQDKGDYASKDDVSDAISELEYGDVSDDGKGNVSVTFGSNLSEANVKAHISAAISELKYADVTDDGNGNVSVIFGSNLSEANVQAYIDEKLGVIENGSY